MKLSSRILQSAAAFAACIVPATAQGVSATSTTSATPALNLTNLAICASTLVDQATGSCIEASSIPSLGKLYPLSTDFFVSTGGNIGMGTFGPLAKLHVVGSTTTELSNGFGSVSVTDSNGQTRVAGTSTNGATSSVEFLDSGLALNTLGGVAGVHIGTNGRVGIGTTSPISDFDIENKVWIAGSPFGLGEGVIMTHFDNGERAAYVGPFSSTQYTMGLHRNGGLFVGGGILHDETLDEVSIYADVKNFRQTNPLDPTTDIVYACVEGPEAAAYVRGTAKLINGYAKVQLPMHFEGVTDGLGMTVSVTPHSANSMGLAVVERTSTHIIVRELLQGKGNYDFDWEAKAVRRGYEKYEIIRPKLMSPRGQQVRSQSRSDLVPQQVR